MTPGSPAPGSSAQGSVAQRTALASFPRSGNTWLRYLIELATGETSGSVYDDRILPRGREGVVIKTHLCNRNEFDRAIHIVRNPFDAIESYFHWKRDVQGDQAVQWEQHVRDAAKEWHAHTLHWSTGDGCPVHSLRYEDLRAAPQRELKALLHWLACAVTDEACARAVEQAKLERMRKLHPTLGEQFFRKGAVGEGRRAFDDAMVRVVTETIGDQLARFGYDHVRS